PKRAMVTAVLGTYLRSLQRVADYSDGCTTAATPDALLMKNRDNDPRFLGMQTLLRVSPDQGYAWLGLSTAGAPGVHSSGMNETGLAIADTHVPSRDIGPGVPRFSSMMHVLQECGSTAQAVDYLLETPQMGLGTLTIVDASGNAAVVECGFSHSAVVDSTLTPGVIPGAALATNHYVTSALASATLPPDDTSADADSQARRTTVLGSLTPQNHPNGVGEEELRALASHHVLPESGQDGDPPASGSLCRHGGSDKPGTISTTIFSPKNCTMDVCLGTPCSTPFFRIGFHGDPTLVPLVES
ncbi:MAG TPA: C45 family peptidase, partial [Beutenbergiaceae bacterium]|nr:C45 family peptidase [Beutenbergiaceae bacterium]